MIFPLRRLMLVTTMALVLGPLALSEAQDQPRSEQRDRLLDADQINLIKVWELPADLSDMRVSVRVPREVMLEVFDRFRDDPLVPKGRAEQQAFLRRPMTEQLGLIFNLAPQNPAIRSYYKDVQVNGEPDSLIEFRRRVYGNYVQRYIRRHFGDGQVPGFVLVNAPGNSLAEMYTNFYILSATRRDGVPMIDRANPRDSLLLQWGLPREAAKYPAPDVPGWRPFFRGLDDDNFQRMADAIDLLYDNPVYGIDYQLPGALPESQQ